MKKKYLLFASLAYSYPILRPLQREIRKRGDEVAWFLEPGCDNLLTEDELHIQTIKEVMKYNPIAVFAAGPYVYDFFPGIKVEVFHGYANRKRKEKIDDHFTIRGWFDIYSSSGPSSTPYFKKLEEQHGDFKVYETGWCKVDSFFNDSVPELPRTRPTILYSSTFSKNITSVYALYDTVERLIQEKPWDWIITNHPKLKQDDPEIVEKYRTLADKYDNVQYLDSNVGVETYRKIDVMLCDSSSIIIEVEILNKPVVTFRNTFPGPHLLDVQEPEKVEAAIEQALTKPAELMKAMHDHTMYHEVHRDGLNSARMLDAVDDFIRNYKGKLKKKPLNLIRKIKLRLKAKYYRW